MANQKNKQENLRKLAGEWFFKAREDELSAKAILDSKEGAASTVCFLSQQMADKDLKGYLVFKGKRFPKIHELDKLVKLCQKIDPEFKTLEEQAKYLTEFYISTRYPGDYFQFSFREAEKAFKKACKIRDFVLLKSSGN
jgi:HEPN domain-containing protein